LVTAGFIVEGDSESILLKHDSVIQLLASINVYCAPGLVLNVIGKNKLYHPNADFSKIGERVSGWVESLQSIGAQVIFFLIDFDNSDSCFTQFKSKVFHEPGHIVIIAKQALEAWYLADHESLSKYLAKKIQPIEEPESFLNPFEQIQTLRMQHSSRKVADKKRLTKDMLKSGFSLARAAAHPNCPSATYFLNKLQSLNTP